MKQWRFWVLCTYIATQNQLHTLWNPVKRKLLEIMTRFNRRKFSYKICEYFLLFDVSEFWNVQSWTSWVFFPRVLLGFFPRVLCWHKPSLLGIAFVVYDNAKIHWGALSIRSLSAYVSGRPNGIIAVCEDVLVRHVLIRGVTGFCSRAPRIHSQLFYYCFQRCCSNISCWLEHRNFNVAVSTLT